MLIETMEDLHELYPEIIPRGQLEIGTAATEQVLKKVKFHNIKSSKFVGRIAYDFRTWFLLGIGLFLYRSQIHWRFVENKWRMDGQCLLRCYGRHWEQWFGENRYARIELEANFPIRRTISRF